jgi:PAS domain S-box-containing protein
MRAEPGTPPPVESGPSVAELVRRLMVAEADLEKSLGSGADAVLDARGHAHLLRHAQAALQQSENRFRALIEKSTDVMTLVAADGTVVYGSPAVRRVLGYAAEELVGHSVFRFFHPDDQARAQAALADLCATKRKSATMVLRYRHKDGTYRCLDGTGTNLLDEPGVHAVVLNYRDVTERNEVEAALRESETHYRTMLEGVEAGVVVHGADSRIVTFNAQAAELLGVAAADLTGRTASDPRWRFVRADGRPIAEAEFPFGRALASRQLVRDIVLGVHRPIPGDMMWLLVSANPVLTALGEVAEVIVTFVDITARIAAEQAVRDNATFTDDVLNSLTAHVVVLDEQGTIIAVNDAWRQFARDNGPSVRDFIGDNYLTAGGACVLAEDQPGADAAASGIRAVLGGIRTSFTLEYPCDSPTQVRWFRMHVSPLTGRRRGVVVSHQDITEQKQGLEALRTSEKRFKALFEQTAVGVALCEVGTGRFVQVNQRYCDIMGRPRAELLQLTFAAITRQDEVGDDLQTVGALRAGTLREFSREKRYLRRDGSDVWTSMTVSAMWSPDETPDYFIAIVQDITERKQLEEQFRQAQKMEAIGTLAGGIAHDFNNILTAIVGYAELARMVLKENPEVRRYLGSVLKASSRATELVRQILTFSRHERPERRVIALQPVVTESLALLRATLPSTIAFDVALAPEAPAVLADATQVHQVLMNLGTNAWHAMKDQPGRLGVTLERCVVDAAHAAQQTRLHPGVYARLSIRDSGCGMDQATQRRIFEPFFTTKAPGEGTGLGLAVVHGVMESHDGAVTVYSQPGAGTVFHLYFPAQVGGEEAAVLEESPLARGRGERVLVVDDEESIVTLMVQALGSLGYAAEGVTQSVAALARVRENPARFALVLSDQTMPEMTGLVLATELRKVRADLPVILMTGYASPPMVERVAAAGIRQLLPKPATLRALATAVHTALASDPAL